MIFDNRMENSKQANLKIGYRERLDALFMNPQPKKLLEFFSYSDNHLNEIQLRSDKSFLERVEKNVSLSKIKILQLMFEFSETINEKQLRYLRNRLKHLNQPIPILIKQGIITMYSDITELKEKQAKEENSHFSKLLTKVLEALSSLLKDYFILKQMERVETNRSTHSLKQILSDNKIENGSRNSLTSINSAQSIKDFLANDINAVQITKSIQAKSIEHLINHELRDEQNQIEDVLETCRICKRSLKVKILQSHIRYCTKRQAFISRREDALREQIQIVNQIKQILESSEQNIQQDALEKNKCGKQLMKIYGKVVQSFDGAPKLQRRNSMNSCKSKMKIRKRLSIEIEQFLQFANDNELLRNFRQYAKQRQLLEKKISSLQNNQLNQWRQSQNSDRSEKSLNSYRASIKSLKTSKAVSVKTKKSLFARKDNSSFSLSDSKIEGDKWDSANVTKLMSIKAHMDQIVNNSDSDTDSLKTEDKARLCKSLSHFQSKDDEQSHEICIKDFDIIKFLGKGAFGKVYMVRRKKTPDIYALKVIKIQSNWGQKQLECIKNEHQILSQIAGEYLVKAPFSFTEGSAHFFVLEYMPGGDLAKIIQKQVYLDERQSQFYLAEIVLAIERLHEMGIIHRDLKSENLIFDEDGHLKLTDFGLSQIRINDKIRKVKKLNCKPQQTDHGNNQDNGGCQQKKCKSKIAEANNTTKIVGTPDYIAPEIISGESLDNLSIDWWSLGVIAYEMMVGCRPFCAKTIDEVISNIENFNIEWPEIGDQEDMISPVAADFIKALLNPDYRERLGAKDIDEIKSHKFFAGVSWLQIKKSKPPLMPEVDRKQQYEYAPEIAELRLEIVNAMGNGQSKSSFKLDNFVRYDILAQQTLESADKKIVKKEARIRKLRSIASNFGNSSGQNNEKVDSNHGSKGLLDDDIEQCWQNFKND